MPLRPTSLAELTIEDERAFSTLPMYQRLKAALVASQYPFLVPTYDTHVSWDRAAFLNLTFWAGPAGADVLVEKHISADVVAHVAWHQVAAHQLARHAAGEPASAEAMFFGEAIASAFDLYLVGKLLRTAPGCDFITTQVPIMTEAAAEAGLPEDGFTRMLESVVGDPEAAFEDLRTLLFDVTRALHATTGAAAAQEVLEAHEGHRFAALLHHYQLSNWVLYGRAYGQAAPKTSEAIAHVDAQLRQASSSLLWLEDNWLPVA